MGMDLVVSLRSSSKHDASAFSAFSAHRALPGSPCAPGGRPPDFLKRRRPQAVVAGGGYQFSNNGDGSFVWRSLHQQDNRHFHVRHHHHHQTETSADNSRLDLGFAVTAPDHTLDVDDEDVCCETSFLHNCNGLSSVDWEKSAIGPSSPRGVVAGVGVPLSLRMLKRKQQGHGKATLTSGLVEVGNSLLKAFSSMVFMMKELQSHCLHIQRRFFNQEIEGLLNQVHREMHASFLWLFQQVFSCTPELMVLLMVLLADFTAFSMASSVPMEMTMSASVPTDVSAFASHMSESGKSIQASIDRSMISSPYLVDSDDQLLDDSGWIGNGGGWNHKRYSAAGNGDGEFDSSKVFSSVNKGLYSVEDRLPPEMSSMGKAVVPMQQELESEEELLSNQRTFSSMADDGFSSMAAALAYKELNLENDALSGSSSTGSDEDARSSPAMGLSNFSPLDHPEIPSFVAPFAVSLENDSYTCYDRTDLAYQYAVSSNATNSMLLTNYAQFLFLVRKDHDRAEELFRRAVLCDPLDGDAISRFASFLWLARRNLSAAGKAYQAAVRADPCNSFHAADYAHFLWNSGQ